MAMKKSAKRSRRRLKRSVRRSLAAVLMITAIGVAAIPVPENYAEDGTTTPSESEVKVPDSYKYPVNDQGESLLPSTYTWEKLHTKLPDEDLFSATTVTELSDGKYQLDWQFKFFTTSVEGNERGIICKYNSTYQQDEVVLNPNVIYKYDQVSHEQFEKFYASSADGGIGDTKYTCKVPNAEMDQFFIEYFENAYQDYVKSYADYQTALEQWKKDPNGTEDTKPKEPEPLVKTPNDLSDDQKLKFYCDENKSSTSKESLKGCKLVDVIDSANPDPVTGANTWIYIPKKIDGQTPTGKFDSLGLRYVSDASIIGIGDDAFKETKNVFKLEIPKEIKYIGKSAFEHSFIKEVSFVNVEKICDYAFKDCEQLTKIDFGTSPTTTVLGTEAFRGTALGSVVFPQTIQEIGPGAFAYCENLQTVDFSKITANPATIGEYAFYNAVALNNVNFMREGSDSVSVSIDTIGDAAFAVYTGVVGNMTTFRFPTKINQNKGTGDSGLGDCVLAGRTNLQNVIMPADFGRAAKADIPDNTFYNCFNLACVEFPDDGSGSCGLAGYKPTELFKTVSNIDFYVRGPELDRNRSRATPRMKTWDAETAVSKVVPYMYVKNGLNYYEVSQDGYLMCIDNNGMLTSCTRKDPDQTFSTPITLPIPSRVANTKVVGIASGCFSDKELNNNVGILKIADDSITVVEDSVFSGWEKLKEVRIGNSVTSIGNNAFKDCAKLEDVYFNTPLSGHEAFKIGTDAFKTQSKKLTFHGDIVEGYAPFEWAVDPENIIQELDGIRVCYKSLSPSYLTVMYNPITDMVTLLDYPKYSQVSQILREAHADELSGKQTYEQMMVNDWYSRYSGEDYDTNRTSFALAWQKAASNEERNALYATDAYGPWVNKDFCGEWYDWLNGNPHKNDQTGGNTGNSSDNTTTGGGTDTAFNVMTDWLFKPIVVHAADVDPGPDPISTPKPYYDIYKYNVVDNVASNDPYRAPTAEEQALVYSTENIVVPAGVESIDVYGYINNLTVDGTVTDGLDRNSKNYGTYLANSWTDEIRNMYNSTKGDPTDDTAVVPGLFSGYYKDFDDLDGSPDREQFARGNDLIKSVTLNGVKYLPDYAFDSCENLQWVVIGDALSDIGKAPFRGCYKMTSVSNNDYYTTENGIIYSKNSDGSLTIEECLSARGNIASGVGEGSIGISSDPNLGSVSTIKPGAFEDCDYISAIDFGMEDTAGLTVIPEDCFRNCNNLRVVTLPRTVNDVGKGAFVGSDGLNTLTFYGKEVKISGSAFDSAKGPTTVRTYKDSAVVRYVNEYGKEYNLTLDKNSLGELWMVTFLDANHVIMSDLVDKEGNQIDNPQYVEDGAYAKVPQNPVSEDWTFEKWVGMNNAAVDEKITQDTIFYAQGYSNSGMVNGKYVIEFYDAIDGKKIGPTQYIVPGGEAIAPTPPTHDGYVFDKWSDSYTDIQANKSIVALYKATTSGGSTNTSGNTTNTSNNTTNNGGGTTSNRTTSSQTSSSTSTTSSSTASTSTTSSAERNAAMYSVTVIGGSGSGSYAQGAPVVITANTPAAGSVFSKWVTESPGVSLASVSTSPTTFTMPANNVTITAEYTAGTAPATTPANSNAGGGGNSQSSNAGSTRVDITKPGISNKDLATANVNGATDNFIIKISETAEATKAVSDALTKEYGSLDNILYYAMDISLYDATGTTKITDTSGISVDITIPIPDALVAYGGNNMAGAVVNGSDLENLNENFTTINGVPCIRFTASHFSPYTIYVDTGNLTEGMLDTTPKTGDPIHPKWFLSIGLACLSIILFMKRDKRTKVKTA